MALTAKQKREARQQKLDEMSNVEGFDAMQSAEIAALNEKAFANPAGVAPASGERSVPSSAGAKVIVALKLGVTGIQIQLCEMVKKFEQNMQGGRDVTEANRVGNVVIIRGTAYPRGTPPEGFPSAPEIVAGYALTRGIDRDFWAKWWEQNQKNPLVMNEFIFADESEDRVRKMALERAALSSGLDPINPKKGANDARIKEFARPSRGEVSDLEPGVRAGSA